MARTTGSWIKGRFDVSPDGFGFVRCGQAPGPYRYRNDDGQVRLFHAAAGDVYVPPETVQAYRLLEGDMVEGFYFPLLGSIDLAHIFKSDHYSSLNVKAGS